MSSRRRRAGRGAGDWRREETGGSGVAPAGAVGAVGGRRKSSGTPVTAATTAIASSTTPGHPGVQASSAPGTDEP
ncbi:hypothetical protein [Kitasatospora sp. MAA4]|uniref:hypothetical protein n=1 Tax=Kitasatospora sp. MAA4 TaxID=3035093 RepID=UPI002473021C|nr:hypothetical protein [Kitasatospora sp. MAA4]